MTAESNERETTNNLHFHIKNQYSSAKKTVEDDLDQHHNNDLRTGSELIFVFTLKRNV